MLLSVLTETEKCIQFLMLWQMIYQSIAEIELSDENAAIAFPKQLRVIKEVTDDDSYKNASLAKI